MGIAAWNRGSQPPLQDSDWLLPFLPRLRAQGGRLLELRCGPGVDAAKLVSAGLDVVAFDGAPGPLSRARQEVSGLSFLRADLALPLPFREGTFGCAVSSLALHYLPWAETRAAFAEVRRVLRQGSPFLFRVNATDDFHHGAGEGEELEPNFYRSPNAFHSETKRFFDAETVLAAADGLFEVEHLEHKTIYRYEEPKRVWECMARARG